MGKVRTTTYKPKKYFGVSKAVVNGRYGFKATFTAPGGDTVELGFFTRDLDAAKAADRATLAVGRKGPLNLNKMNYQKKDIDREKEHLRQLGILQPPAPPALAGAQLSQQQQQADQAGAASKPKKRSKAKHKAQQPQPQLQVPDQPELPAAGLDTAPAHTKDSRKRKAASDSPDAVAAVSVAPRAQHDITAAAAAAAAPKYARPKRRKVKQQHSASLEAGPAPMHEVDGQQRDTAPKAAGAAGPKAAAAAAATEVAAPVSTALVLAAPALPATMQPTGAAVQFGLTSSSSSVSQELVLSQLRSALAAHEASKRQLHAALNALEASEGQLAAVARAAGMQLC